MSKTTILYKDVAPGAAEDAAVSTSAAMTGTDPAKLPAGVPSVAVISGQWNAWALNGTYRPRDSNQRAFWSSELSGEDCTFQNDPVITVNFDQQYSSLGISLVFDPATGDYCTEVNLKWYQGGTLKANVTFYPNAAQYYCKQTVTSYDKVVLTLRSTKHPFKRARLNQILFGVYRPFDMTEIRKASIVNDMDLLASGLPVSTLKLTLDSREDVDYMFQLKQPVEARNDNELIGVYYIDGSRRTSKNVYDIDCYDAFGVLGESTFSGGVYAAYSAAQLLQDIVGAGFALEVEAASTALTGAIQSCTKREAIQQVLFAWGVCASTDGRESVRVFQPGGTSSEIGADRTYLGGSTETAAIVTEVRVTAHAFAQDANGSVEINGVKYSDTQAVYTVTNPNVTATDKQNVVEVTGATLIAPAIGQATAQRVYNHYARRNTSRAKFVWRGEKLGDRVTLPNTWGGTNAGNLSRMEIALSNTVVANSELLGV
ncbi:MAG: hypothetical protein AAGU32_01070 [Bacillota bacterium]